MNYKKWSKEEIEFLKKNYKNLTKREMSKEINRSYYGIFRKLEKLNLRLSNEEVKKLNSKRMKSNNPMKNKEISKKQSKTLKEGYKSGRIKSPSFGKVWTKEEKEKQSKIMKKLYDEGKLKPTWIGRKHTEEHKNKISKKAKERWNTKEGRKKYLKCITKEKRKEASKRMKLNNPCKRDDVKEKIRKARAKQKIPKKDTSIELKIQTFLTQLGIEFFTHSYRKEIKHAYQCDIWIPSMNLVIECDGDYWHGNPKKYTKEQLNQRQKEQKERDALRTKELLEKGFRVMRIWESEIRLMNLKDFKDKIYSINEVKK